MKNTQLKNTLILIGLIIALVVQMETTANLYGFITNLKDVEKTIAKWFVGFSCEFAIFVCIYCGSRTAGIFFAILSFFVGMTFHNWYQPVFEFHSWNDFTFTLTNQFWASFLQQLALSSAVWYLSELFVKFDSVTGINEHITKLNEEVAELEGNKTDIEQSIIELKQQHDFLDKAIIDRDIIHKGRMLDLERVYEGQKEEFEKTERRVNELKKTALSLQNSNNRRSGKGKEVNNAL